MAISTNQIYDYVVRDISQGRTVYCSSRQEPISSSNRFPAVEIVELDHPVYQRALPLSFGTKESVSARRDFEVHVYSNLKNGALAQAREIMTDIETAFRALWFIETSCIQTPNADPTIIQLVARFTRNICDGDTLTT